MRALRSFQTHPSRGLAPPGARERSRLPNVEVRCHPASLAAEEKELPPVRVTSSPKGEFQVEDLPAGPYAITLHCGGDDAPPIPDIYQTPSTTRFRVKLSQDVPNMNLLVSSKQPRR